MQGSTNANLQTNAMLEVVYPVGSVYINASNSANPGTIFGFGTWVSIGSGRCLVGVDTNDSSFNTVGKTGGEKAHTLSTDEMPSHTHIQNAHGHGMDSAGEHVHTAYGVGYYGSGGYRTSSGDHDHGDTVTTSSGGDHTHTIYYQTATNRYAGGGQAHNNLQPYLTVYMWKRTG